MLSVSILNMYAEGFESLVKLPKLSLKKKAQAKPETEQNKTEETKPHINYFAGPTNVFEPSLEAAL